MRFVAHSAAKDLRRIARDPAALALWTGIPLVIGLLIVLAFGGEGSAPRAKLLVVDLDGSLGSRLLTGALGQGPLADLLEVETVGESEGRARMDDAGASALLVIPEGFGRALLDESAFELEVVTNPAEQVRPRLVTEILEVLTDAIFYAHRLVGDELRAEIRALSAGPPEGANAFDDARIAGVSVRINRLAERIAAALDPLPITVEDVAAAHSDTLASGGGDERADAGLGVAFLPGVLFMALLFISQGLAEDLWREREARTLRRIVTSASSTSAFLLGKILAGIAVLALVAFVALAAGFAYLGLPVTELPLAVAWSALAGGLLLVLILAIQVIAWSRRAANVLTMSMVFPLIMLGGSFFPMEVMPDWLARIGRWTPNGWALVELKTILSGSPDPARLALGAGAAFLVGAMLFTFVAWRLRSGFAQGA